MKLLITTLLLCFTTLESVNAQISNSFTEKEAFVEGKNYIEGDMLIQLAPNASIRSLIEKAPANFEVKINRLLSQPMKVWLINFNYNNVSNHVLLNWLYEQDEVAIAQNNHKIKMIKEQREGSEGSVPTMYEKISSDKLETIKNSLKSINNSFLGREYLKKKKALILKIFDDAPLTKKYDEKLDALPESGASNYTGETKKKRKEIVKEKREKCVSYSKIAGMVADKLACQSNRKYVRKILEASRSSLLEKKLIKVEKKLSKIS